MLHFHSPNEFPIEAVMLSGVSVKVTSNPIGQFGTGLKYAIAVILRNGGTISLLRDGAVYTFHTAERTFRDQPYQAIIMSGPDGDTQLPFTLDYGKNWELWQAYRELYSNCLDETGGVSESPVSARTVFSVRGLEAAHEIRKEIFFEPDPGKLLFECPAFALYEQPSSSFFYRGIRVADYSHRSKLTFNMRGKIDLTEDRTLKGIYLMLYQVTGEIVTSMGETALKAFFADSAMTSFFGNWSTYCSLPPSAALKKIVRMGLGSTEALAYVAKNRPIEDSLEQATLTSHQYDQFQRASSIVKRLLPQFEKADIKFCSSLRNVAGVFLPKTEEIWISMVCFEEGFDYLVATLYEEGLHKYRGVQDESRALQEILFKKVVQLALEVYK